jgi:hypothetical protein
MRVLNHFRLIAALTRVQLKSRTLREHCKHDAADANVDVVSAMMMLTIAAMTMISIAATLS